MMKVVKLVILVNLVSSGAGRGTVAWANWETKSRGPKVLQLKAQSP